MATLTMNKALTLMDLMTTKFSGASITPSVTIQGQIIGTYVNVDNSESPVAPGVYIEELPDGAYSFVGTATATRSVVVALYPEFITRYHYLYISKFSYSVQNTSLSSTLTFIFRIGKIVASASGTSSISITNTINVGTTKTISESTTSTFIASNILVDLDSWSLISGTNTSSGSSITS